MGKFYVDAHTIMHENAAFYEDVASGLTISFSYLLHYIVARPRITRGGV